MQNDSYLFSLIPSQAERYGERVALRYRDYDAQKWVDVSWNTFAGRVHDVSSALLQLGVEVQEKVAVFSENMPECLYVDFGAYALRAVTIPFFATSSEAQVKYMATDAAVRYIFVGEQSQYDVAFRVSLFTPVVKRLIMGSPKM